MMTHKEVDLLNGYIFRQEVTETSTTWLLLTESGHTLFADTDRPTIPVTDLFEMMEAGAVMTEEWRQMRRDPVAVRMTQVRRAN